LSATLCSSFPHSFQKPNPYTADIVVAID
jgi:hypothetical protein